MPVPTNAASQPAFSMMVACAALGIPRTARTRSSRTRSARSRVEARAGPSGTCRARARGRRSAVEAAIEPRGIVPEELALLSLRQIPRHHGLDRLREPALAVRIVRGVHQDVLAEQLDHGPGQLDALGHLDRLKEAPGGDVVARLARQRRQRARAGPGVLVEALGPEREPAMAGFEHSEP